MDDDNRLKNYNTSNNSDDFIDLNEIIKVLKTRRMVIFKTTILVVVACFLFLITQTNKYTAQTQLQIEARNTNIVDIESVLSGLSSDATAIASQLDIIRSRKLIKDVVKKLNLTNDPEFNTSKSKDNLLNAGFSIFSFFDSEAEKRQKLEEKKQVNLTRTIDNVLKNLQIIQKPKSYTINLKFISQDPKKAARIANVIAQEYLMYQLTVKFDATKRANEWLNSKTADLQKKLYESEVAVQEFRKKHGLIKTRGSTLNDQQLSELNSQLILARAERAQAQSRLENSENGVETIAEILNSRLIQNLRSQEAEILRKKSDLSNRYGPRHPTMKAVNQEQSKLQDMINLEERKIIDSLKNEVEIAKNREESLEKSLYQLEEKAGQSTFAEIQLAELERQMNSNRSLYESFLNRFKETTQNQDMEQADAKIISEAEIPLIPSYPKKKLMLLIAIIMGTGLGVVIAFILEKLDNSYRTISQLEADTNLPAIAMIPQVNGQKDIIKYITSQISSSYCEAVRSVLTAVHFSNPDNIPQSLMITSAIPKDGKSIFASSLASVHAKSGHKVLLVDCDMRRPTIAKIFKQDFKNGLSDLLMENVALEDVICIDKRSGLHFIPSHPNNHNSHDLLASKKMQNFVEYVKSKYDLVIFDLPPVLAVSDALIMSKLVDTTIFVARWEKTPREIVKNALKQIRACKVKVVGSVLSMVDIKKHSKSGYQDSGYYYATYKDYYNS